MLLYFLYHVRANTMYYKIIRSICSMHFDLIFSFMKELLEDFQDIQIWVGSAEGIAELNFSIL